MLKKPSLQKLIVSGFVAALILIAGFNAPVAEASSGNFNLKVSHMINGKDLGLDKALPVNVYINGGLAIQTFTFGEVVNTSLPAGTYTINVTLLDGTPLPSMDLGPLNIPGGVDVDIKAKLDPKDTPFLKAKVAETKPADTSFDLTVKHGINGRDLGLSKKLPVNVYINGALAIPGFEFGDKVKTALPGGDYTITVTLLDGTPLPTMTISNATIPNGVEVLIKARLTSSDVPFLNVRID